MNRCIIISALAVMVALISSSPATLSFAAEPPDRDLVPDWQWRPRGDDRTEDSRPPELSPDQRLLPDDRAVIGADDRVRITPTTDAPWRSIVSLELQFSSGPGGCTGWFIGPRIVATAGHCVFNPDLGGWATGIRVIPGRDGVDEPFGSQTADDWAAFAKWVDDGNDQLDFGAVFLPDETLSNAVGWFRYGAFTDTDLEGLLETANLAGYPGVEPMPFDCPDEANFTGCTLWAHWDDIVSLSFAEFISCPGFPDPCEVIQEGLAFYPIDTEGGQSGAPVWLSNGSQRVVVAIHTGGNCAPGLNCGVLLTPYAAAGFESVGAAQHLEPKFGLPPIPGPYICESPPPLAPSTAVSIMSSATQVVAGDSVTLRINETNDGDVNLTNPFVDLAPLGLTLDETSIEFRGGDTDDDGELDVGETWTWRVVATVAEDTTYTATGHGTDPLGTDITYPADPDEQDSVEVDVISPSTTVAIRSSASAVTAGDTVRLGIREANDGDADLASPFVELAPLGLTLDKASPQFRGGDTDGDGNLDVGETWRWVVPTVVTVPTTYTATGHGIDPLGTDITYPADLDEQDSVFVDVNDPPSGPSTSVKISSAADVIPLGASAVLRIRETNDGDADLTNPFVELDPLALSLDNSSSQFIGGDGDGDGVLDKGETWRWDVCTVVSAATTYTATGHGIDPLGIDITYPLDLDERDSIFIDTITTGIGPSTVIAICSSAKRVSGGDSVTLVIAETNDGDVDLTNPFVELAPLAITLTKTSPEFTEGDINGDGVLDVGETWSWAVSTMVAAPTTYTATGHGTDPLGTDITYPADPDEQETVFVDVI